MYNSIVQGPDNNSSEEGRRRFIRQSIERMGRPIFLAICQAFGTEAGSLEMAFNTKASSVDKTSSV